MKRLGYSLLTVAMCMGTAALVGCNDNNDNNSGNTTTPTSTETIKGTAATGKAFSGKVVVKNKNGVESAPVTIGADGKFSVTIEKGAPYIIKAYNEGDTLYSFAAGATDNVNVTQLTTQAIFAVNTDPDNRDYSSLADIYSQWKAVTAQTSASDIQSELDKAAKEAVANLKSYFDANGYGGTKGYPDLFKTSFTVGAAGLDKVLDNVRITGLNQACTNTGSTYTCNVKYQIGESTNYEWNYNISTDGITINLNPGTGGTGGTGNYNLKITVAAAGIVGGTYNVNNIPKPDNQSEFCSATDIAERLPAGFSFTINSCSFNGTTGTINATVKITTPITADVSYSVKYEYTPA